MINIKILNQLLKKNGLQKLPLNFTEQLNNKNLNIELLKQTNNIGCNLLIYSLIYNKIQKLGLKNNDIINIINLYPEQLLQFDITGWNPLIYIFTYNKTEELGFNFNYINELYEQQINKKYNYTDINNTKQTILFNEKYIKNKMKEYNYNLTFFHEFLDYRKILLEKRNITNILKIKQENKIKNSLVKI